MIKKKIKTKKIRNKFYEFLTKLDKEERLGYFKYNNEKLRFYSKVEVEEEKLKKKQETIINILSKWFKKEKIEKKIIEKYIERKFLFNLYDLFYSAIYSYERMTLKEVRNIKECILKEIKEWNRLYVQKEKNQLEIIYYETKSFFSNQLKEEFFFKGKLIQECFFPNENRRYLFENLYQKIKSCIMYKNHFLNNEKELISIEKEYLKLKKTKDKMTEEEKKIFLFIENYLTNNLSTLNLNILKENKKIFLCIDDYFIDNNKEIIKNIKKIIETKEINYEPFYLYSILSKTKEEILNKHYILKIYNSLLLKSRNELYDSLIEQKTKNYSLKKLIIYHLKTIKKEILKEKLKKQPFKLFIPNSGYNYNLFIPNTIISEFSKKKENKYFITTNQEINYILKGRCGLEILKDTKTNQWKDIKGIIEIINNPNDYLKLKKQKNIQLKKMKIYKEEREVDTAFVVITANKTTKIKEEKRNIFDIY